MGTAEKKDAPKKNILEIFMNGTKRGFYIGINQVLPAMFLGYVLVQFLQLTGLVNLLGVIFGPVMSVFGLPGETVVVIIAAFFAKAAGAATAANMYATGIISAGQATILLLPCMLVGTFVSGYARVVLVSNVAEKYRMLLLVIPVIDAVVGMFVMKFILIMLGAV
jgi:spore maturation protein SpmB